MARNSLPMKCRLNQPSLGGVQWIFAGQQAIAHHQPAALHDRPTHMLGSVDDKKFLDQVRMVQKKCVLPSQAEVHDIAVALGEVLQVREWISAETECLANA
jgi:hypothetical protein